MADKLLLVEDEAKLSALLRDYLAAAGYEVVCCDRGDTALAALQRERPALVLLDLMLPALDGIEICRRIRQLPDTTLAGRPVIMLTALVDEVDRILGLEIGADDYLCKPFSPREVVARVRAHLRREARRREMVAEHDIVVDRDAMRVRVHGTVVDLTPVEFRLLACLLEAPGRVYSREQLMRAAYTDHRVVSDRTIDTHVKNLRRKLTDPAGVEPPIQSVYGVGYRFDR